MNKISPTASHRNISEMLAGVTGLQHDGEHLSRLLDWDLPDDDGSVNMQNFMFDIADIQGIKSPTPGGDLRMSPTQNKIGQMLQVGGSFKFSPEPQVSTTSSQADGSSSDGRVVPGLEVYGRASHYNSIREQNR